MTDAPKIDTQAPDTSSKMPPHIWATYYADHPGTAGLWDHIKRYEWEDRVEYVRRDLADARAAAAWIEGRDAAADLSRVSMHLWKSLHPVDVAKDISSLTPPDDLAATLDRLIAERVREARNTAWDEAADIMDGYGQHGYAEEFRACICAARGSKEGQS